MRRLARLWVLWFCGFVVLVGVCLVVLSASSPSSASSSTTHRRRHRRATCGPDEPGRRQHRRAACVAAIVVLVLLAVPTSQTCVDCSAIEAWPSRAAKRAPSPSARRGPPAPDDTVRDGPVPIWCGLATAASLLSRPRCKRPFSARGFRTMSKTESGASSWSSLSSRCCEPASPVLYPRQRRPLLQVRVPGALSCCISRLSSVPLSNCLRGRVDQTKKLALIYSRAPTPWATPHASSPLLPAGGAPVRAPCFITVITALVCITINSKTPARALVCLQTRLPAASHCAASALLLRPSPLHTAAHHRSSLTLRCPDLSPLVLHTCLVSAQHL
jgi:hypothetical protein